MDRRGVTAFLLGSFSMGVRTVGYISLHCRPARPIRGLGHVAGKEHSFSFRTEAMIMINAQAKFVIRPRESSVNWKPRMRQ
jgi:hypothetical protein